MQSFATFYERRSLEDLATSLVKNNIDVEAFCEHILYLAKKGMLNDDILREGWGMDFLRGAGGIVGGGLRAGANAIGSGVSAVGRGIGNVARDVGHDIADVGRGIGRGAAYVGDKAGDMARGPIR